MLNLHLIYSKNALQKLNVQEKSHPSLSNQKRTPTSRQYFAWVGRSILVSDVIQLLVKNGENLIYQCKAKNCFHFILDQDLKLSRYSSE